MTEEPQKATRAFFDSMEEPLNCPVCNKPLNEGDKVIFVVSENRGFWGITYYPVHLECAVKKDAKT